MPYHLLMPLLAAAGYTVSSLFFKKGYGEGASAAQAFHWANLLGMLLLGGTAFLGTGMAWADAWRPALVAGLIYAGSLATFAAIRAGDVSLVTPLLGAKVVFVALVTPWIIGSGLSWLVWLACFLAAAGIFLMGKMDFATGQGKGQAVGYCLISCAFFAVSDVILQKWAPEYGGYTFLGSLAALVGIYSLIHLGITGFSGLRLPPGARKSIVWGGVLLAAQGITMGVALGFFHDAARVNVVYGSRGLWSLFLVWFVGKRFGNAEATDSKEAFGWRIGGCLLVTAGIVLALL
jgi:drug/metabolite transporter (DMT)-like permease